MPAYPQMAYNNTYDLQIINETEFQTTVDAFPTCQNLTLACRELIDTQDSQGNGNNAVVNAACFKANKFCFDNMWKVYNKYGVSSSLLLNEETTDGSDPTERHI